MKRLPLLFRLSLLNTVLFLSACSTRGDWTLHQLYLDLEQTPPQLQETLTESYRGQELYREYDTTLWASALFRSRKYREFISTTLAEAQQLDKLGQQEFSLRQQQNYASRFEFLLFLYDGDNQKISFGERDSLWQVRLEDDDGDTIAPLTVRKLKPETRELVLLRRHLRDLDRWVEVYEVSFPKLNKAATGVSLGSNPLQLTLSSVEGRLTLQWPTPELFYQ